MNTWPFTIWMYNLFSFNFILIIIQDKIKIIRYSYDLIVVSVKDKMQIKVSTHHQQSWKTKFNILVDVYSVCRLPKWFRSTPVESLPWWLAFYCKHSLATSHLENKILLLNWQSTLVVVGSKEKYPLVTILTREQSNKILYIYICMYICICSTPCLVFLPCLTMAQEVSTI